MGAITGRLPVCNDTLKMPQLPPELWIHILHFATTVPGQMQVELQNPLDDTAASLPLPHILSPHSARADFIAAQATRAAIVRVCRDWHTIATPYLYENVCVPSSATLPILAEAMARYGQLVRRLDLLLEDSGAHQLAPLTDVFSLAHRLEILNISTRAAEKIHVPHRVMCALRVTCAPSLLSLSWDPASSLCPTIQDMQSLLCAVPNLRTLGQLQWPDCGPGYPLGCPYTLPILKRLNSMTLIHGHDDHGVDSPTFPSLRHIIIGKSTQDGCVDAFVRAHAHALRSAIVEVAVEDQEALAPLMACEQLDSLVLHMAPDMVRALSLWRMPLSLRRLGIYVHEVEGEARELVVMLGHISTMEAPAFLRSDGFALVYRLFARAGWRLEDRDGCLLIPL
ncbi:hypothetical protein PENSPDRAFT_435540 [Peniophora sp. CONT]|nr:hypothetical protein PENSPDRAFT_435540 [Peniophora sp. CONT]